jgi:hypothetical protein
MKKSLATLLAMFCFGAGSVHAMDGNFDRELEVRGYLQEIATKTNGEMTEVAERIFYSGIDDARLAKAINDRLLDSADIFLPPPGSNVRKRGTFSRPDVSDRYALWMVKALISTGSSEYDSTYRLLTKSPEHGGVVSDKVRTHIRYESDEDELEWHRKKNALMASRKFHLPGSNERVSQLMNLITSDDLDYREFGIERVAVEKISDARLNKLLEEIVTQYVKRAEVLKRGALGRENKFISHSVKQLGLSGDMQYRAVLEKVAASRAPPAVKKHAAAALDRLK